MLTSHSSQEMAEIGLPAAPRDNVLRLARLTRQAGLDGVVCSAQEAAALRQDLGPDFVLVTPGIRPIGAQRHDQQRVLSPREAVAQGAHYLVIGRPITQSPDPHAALAAISSELDSN
jgi:orotidine-5'-phosphate decarboxylase